MSDASLSGTPVDELIALALRSGDESDMHRRALGELRQRGDQVTFDRARALVIDGPGERDHILGLDVLAWLGGDEGLPGPFVEESVPIVESRANPGESPRVLKAAITALGDLRAKRATPVVLAHVDHPDPTVRRAAARALAPPGVTDDPPPAAVMDAVFALMEDTDSDVRSWATFALAHFDVDTPEVGDALFAMLGDEDGDIAVEALRGLARRHDVRALEPTIRWLERRDLPPGDLILEVFDAALELADARCLPALYALHEEWGDDPPAPEPRMLAASVERIAATLETDGRTPELAAKIEAFERERYARRRSSGLAAAIRECERGSATDALAPPT